MILAYLEGPSAEKRSIERDRYSAKHLYPVFTGRELHTLSPADIQAFIDGSKDEGASPGTINRELGLLSSAIN